MEAERFRCCWCKRLKLKRTRDQRYCDERECQKARKNAWRREKYATDADYRANQRDSTKAWLAARGGSAAYHRAYREAQSTEPGRTSRTSGGSRGKAASVDDPKRAESANSDAETAHSAVKSGLYVISLVSPSPRANSDAFLAEMLLISPGCAGFANIDPLGSVGANR